MIHACPKARAGPRELHMLVLNRRRRDARGFLGGKLDRTCAGRGATVAAEADMDWRPAVDNGLSVHVSDRRIGEIVDGGVVVQSVALPAAALVTGAAVTVAIVDAAVEPDPGAPITGVEGVAAAPERPGREM